VSILNEMHAVQIHYVSERSMQLKGC